MTRVRVFPVAALAATAIVVSLAHAQQTTADPRTWPQYIDGVAHMGPFAWRPGAEAVRNLAGAVAGGQVKAGPLAICRARHQGAVHPGKLWDRKCLIGFGGKEVAAPDFDVLMRSADPKYAPVQQYFPTDRWVAPGAPEARAAFVGGQAGAQGLRVCRVKLQDGLHPGKEFAGKCNVGWGGKEQVVANYQVLVLPNLMPRAPATAAATQARSEVASAITKQINAIDPKTDKVVSTVELVTVVKHPARLTPQQAIVPRNISVISFTEVPRDEQSCPNKLGSDCRQRVRLVLDANVACRLDGNYVAKLRLDCLPGAPLAACRPGAHDIPFKLRSENFCATKTIGVPKK